MSAAVLQGDPLHRPDVALAAHAKETQEEMNWLPDMDLNHDKQIQSLLCYRYTIGQAETT